MLTRMRRCDNKAGEAHPADSQAVIVGVCAVRTAGYVDCRPDFRILCGFI